MNIYELESEDLSTLGRMGSQTEVNWRKFFKNLDAAKKLLKKIMDIKSLGVEVMELHVLAIYVG